MFAALVSPTILQVINNYGYLAVAFGISLESIGVPFPAETVLVAASIYAGAGHLSILGVIIASSIGAIIGDNIGFTVGRYGGYKLLLKFGKYIRIYPQHLGYAQRFFKKHGGKTVFLGRFTVLLRMWAAVLAGANQMEWKQFLMYNAAGGVLWSITFGLLGYFLGRNLPLLTSALHAIGLAGLIVLVVIIVTVIVMWRRIMQQVEEELSGE